LLKVQVVKQPALLKLAAPEQLVVGELQRRLQELAPDQLELDLTLDRL
jgi:hypothetical protein